MNFDSVANTDLDDVLTRFSYLQKALETFKYALEDLSYLYDLDVSEFGEILNVLTEKVEDSIRTLEDRVYAESAEEA